MNVGDRIKHRLYGDGIVQSVSPPNFTVNFQGRVRTFLLSDPRFIYIGHALQNLTFPKTKILRIDIKGLFNRLNYSIELNPEEVSILTAPNGCGKTTIFKILSFLFATSRETLLDIKSIPFDSFSCLLSNGKTIELFDEENRDMSHARLWESSPILGKTLKISGSKTNVQKNIYDFFGDSRFSDDELLASLFDESPRRRGELYIFDSICSSLNNLLEENDCLLGVSFIDANRLQIKYSYPNKQQQLNSSYYRDRLYSDEDNKIDYLQYALNDMNDRLKDTYSKYTSLMSEARSELPKRYLDSSNNEKYSLETIEKQWTNYYEELRKYQVLGLLDEKQTDVDPRRIQNVAKNKMDFLSIYISVFSDTIAPFRSIYPRLKLFFDIFNKRNETTNKTIKFSQEGMKIYSNDQPLDIESLSSGEKNDFIMFYRLIFCTPENSIVLIDEPEISLHITWQEEYMDELINICKENNFQAIVATHSPNIVGGHSDLIVNKGAS